MALSLPSIAAILILDGNGKRIAVKYYTETLDRKSQINFEKKLYQKTQKAHSRVNANVLLYDRHLVLYKYVAENAGGGVYYYVLADSSENELIVASVLTALEDTICNLLRNQVDRKTMVENLDLVLLAVDELVDDGIILETDSEVISARVAMRSGAEKEVPFTELTLTGALSSAKDQFVRSFR